MNETNTQSRANEVWRRFVGMFGGDAVERKYGKSIPPEWVAMLARLKDYEIDRGIKRLAYSGRDAVPSLPAFTKLCRSISSDEIDEGPRVIALPAPDQSQFDRWALAANEHFMRYIRRALSVDTRAYGIPGTKEQREIVETLVRYKNAWAQDMREWGVDSATGEVLIPSPGEQRKAWEVIMRDAEMAVTRLDMKVAA